MVRVCVKSWGARPHCWSSSWPSLTPLYNRSKTACSSAFSPLWMYVVVTRFLVPSAKRMSSTEVTGVAPVLMRLLQPTLFGLVILPGTTRTSLPCSSANRAVCSVPLRSVASIMRSALPRPATIRLRAMKFCFRLGVPTGYSEMIAPPCSRSRFARFVLLAG